MKIRWNWGTGIALTLILFVAMMASFVYKAMQQDFDLVSETYYEDELKYEEVIKQKKNAANLKGEMNLEIVNDQIQLSIPSDFNDQEIKVAVHMYCQQDADKDFKLEKDNFTGSSIAIKHPGENTGRWLAKTTIEANSTTYYFEPKIVL